MKKGQIYTCRVLQTKYQVSKITKIDGTLHGTYIHFVELDSSYRPILDHGRIVHSSYIDIKNKIIL